MNKKIKFIFLVIFSIISILVTAFVIITYSGYKIDFRYFRLTKTGSIYINTNPTKADIYINNEKTNQKTPAIVNQIIPGRYDIKLEKKGYKTWETNIEIQPEITTFLNYELIYKDIELNPGNEFPDNKLFISNNDKYIAYIKEEDKMSNVYIYNVATKDEFKVYSTDKSISNIKWSYNDKKLLLIIDNKFFVLDLRIMSLPVIDKIESGKLLNLNSIIKNIDDAIWNSSNDNEVLITTKDILYKINLSLETFSNIKINDYKGPAIFLDQKIIYINKNSNVAEYDISSDINNEYKKDVLTSIKQIFYKNGFIVFLDNQENLFFYKKNLKSEPIKLRGNSFKINKTKIITFNNSEINIYNERSGLLENTLRYGQKIIDMDFYDENYMVLVLQNGIKLINIDGNINELDMTSSLTTIEKVIVTDTRINLIYKDANKYMISNMDLK